MLGDSSPSKITFTAKNVFLILQCYCNKYAVNTTCNHVLLECIPVYFSIFVTYVMCCVGDC